MRITIKDQVKTTVDRRRPTRGEKLAKSLRGAGEFKRTTNKILALMRGPPAEGPEPSAE
jgi:hypothetical protein